MDRRSMLVAVGGALGGLAGCSGDGSDQPGGRRPGVERPTAETSEPTPESTPEPTPVPIRFQSYSFEASEGEETVVILSLSNPGEERRETTMTVAVENEAGEQVTASTEIDVGAGEEATYRVTVDVPWSWFRDNRNLQGVRFADAE